jgi:hypothetical protein
MRPIVPLLLTAVLLAGPAVGTASAVSVRDLIMLQREGLSDDVLVALIETDGSEFHLTAADIVELRRQGLSERVIIAMLRTLPVAVLPAASARDAVGAPTLAESFDPVVPDVGIVDRNEVRAGTPVVVNVTQQVEQTVEQPRESTRYVAVPVAVPVAVRVAPRAAPREPVYWGWGGQRRPDSWDPTPRKVTRPESKPPPGGGGSGVL